MEDILDLIASQQWLALSALALGFAVRLVKQDSKLPVTIPQRYRPALAFALGAVAGVLELVVAGHTWREATVTAVGAPLLAIVGHVVGVEGLRGGREIPIPGLTKTGPRPPMNAIMVVLAVLLLSGCAFLRAANSARLDACDAIGEQHADAIEPEAERLGIPVAELWAIWRATCLIRAQEQGEDAVARMGAGAGMPATIGAGEGLCGAARGAK